MKAANSVTEHAATVVYRYGARSIVVILGMCALLYASFRPGFDYSAQSIWTKPEYGHALIIPFIFAFLVYQKRDVLRLMPFNGSWIGASVVAVAVALNLIGGMASVLTLQQYATVFAFYGLTLAVIGVSGVRALAVPLLILVLMVPLPDFIYNSLSNRLQLVSSIVGVWFIRLFGISVYLQGNVIDLGAMKLQVAEACDGLRYLFPLMTLGFIVAYFFQAPMWKRVVLFLSSVPIAILMNSLRVGTIGIMVEHWGIGMAEGFLHQFQGWAVFMACLFLLFLEMAVLSQLGSRRLPWRAIFGLELPGPAASDSTALARQLPKAAFGAAALLSIALIVSLAAPARRESIPVRSDFAGFPLSIRDWAGRRDYLDRIYTNQLRLDDYLLADYWRGQGSPVNLYVAWYDSQQAGRSAHSPRSCLPAGGWEILSFNEIGLPGIAVNKSPLRVNRVLIQSGSERLLVYYWFQQRGRVVTNEYAAKWYLFWDSLTRNRTDGALIRFSVPIPGDDDLMSIESQLMDFVAEASKQLDRYVPS